MGKKKDRFRYWLDEASAIVDGKFTQGIGDDGARQVDELARRLPLQVAVAWLATFKTVTLGDLPKKPGVYVSSVAGLGYVGVASNIFSRWWSMASFVPGHLAEGSTSRSKLLIDRLRDTKIDFPSVEVMVRVHSSRNYERLAVEEVLTYAAMVRISGDVELSWWDRSTVNSPAYLGSVKRADAVPVVGCKVATGEHHVFSTQHVASEVTGVLQGGISMVVCGKSSSCSGWAFRHASDDEAALLNDGCPSTRFTPCGDSVVEVTKTYGGKHRVAWEDGPLSSDACVVIDKARKRKDNPSSGIPGVHWRNNHQKWEVRANRVVDGRKVLTAIGVSDSVDEAISMIDEWIAEDPENRMRCGDKGKSGVSVDEQEVAA